MTPTPETETKEAQRRFPCQDISQAGPLRYHKESITMSDRAHLKFVALLWACLGIYTDNHVQTTEGALLLGAAGVAYIASFFARREA